MARLNNRGNRHLTAKAHSIPKTAKTFPQNLSPQKNSRSALPFHRIKTHIWQKSTWRLLDE